jgi:hypothetical protein
VTRLDTFARVIRHFGEFGASGHCLRQIHLVKCNYYIQNNRNIETTNRGKGF